MRPENPEGLITDIQRSSVVDGPGIRTTVFLKGCPLVCPWCHNPETQSPQRELGYRQARCIGCGRCMDACPVRALSLAGQKIVVDRERCVGCLSCSAECPVDALFAYGRVVHVDEVLAVVLKDRPYYEVSGGGVTVSGGEPMLQAGFALALLEACRKAGVHTCLDTAGVGALTDFKRSLDGVDLYLFDYKVTDPALHQRLIGAPLEAVMLTLELLLEAGARVRLRCPLIPGMNDTPEHLLAIARISQRSGIDGVDLLPWHRMGQAKTASIGRRMDAALPAENTTEDQKAHYRAIIMAAGGRGIHP